ncbi:hypothetical protein ACFO0J_14230 [Castellaniella hirudinis]|uniref:Cytochrome-c oxidase n=1 Tax=Castellaniella hirudinis TaxID=1144617 RepID=A0ABV8S2A3_9BURK
MQTDSTADPAFSTAGVIWLKLAILYLLIGIVIGIGMGATENFALRPVHTHLNLLGWATMALAGLIYCIFPKAGRSRLSRIHFWLQNIALPVMLISLALLVLGHPGVIPLLAVAEIATGLSIVTFAANIFLNVGAGRR